MAEQTYSYTYDDNGNIISASFWNESFSYAYDSQNQLIRENNSRLGNTYTWTYDDAGNITSCSTYPYTTGELGEATSVIQYRYEDSEWGDLLTGFGSNTMTYDEIGNMLTYGTRSFTWEHGRQLASTTKNGVTWTYSYDANGMRTGRTNGTDTYEYVYNGSQLMRMVRNGVTVDFTYINGIPATISFGGNTFYYIVNGQGDVTGITDSEGNLQISFYYGAWGRTYYIYAEGAAYASTLLAINPLAYRGYVFDQETGMYYLQSRYYVPILGRFLNADAYASTGQGFIGNNMFAYCLNNPVNSTDEGGELADSYMGWVGQEIGITIYEWITGEEHPARQIQEEEKEIAKLQTELINSAAKGLWGAYSQGYAIQQELQRENGRALVRGFSLLLDNYEEAIDVTLAEIAVSQSIYNLAKLAVCGSPATAVIGGLAIAGWGLYRAIKGLISAVQSQEGESS